MGFFCFLFLFIHFLWPGVYEQSPWLFSFISVSSVQIINHPWVWYSHNIQPMIKMLNQSMTQSGTQATGLGVMIGRCSPNSQHGRPSHHPANIGYSLFRHTNDDLKNHTNQRRKRKTWTREENQLALHCYFWWNPLQRRYRKRKIEIWQECASFQTTSLRLADQVRTIIKKGWFSNLEILEIQKGINNEHNKYKVPNILRINE